MYMVNEIKQEKSLFREKKISTKGIDQLALFGLQDKNLRLLENNLAAKLVARGSDILIQGNPLDVDRAEAAITELVLILNQRGELVESDIDKVLRYVNQKNSDFSKTREPSTSLDSVILYTKKGTIKPKSEGQENYCKCVMKNDIVFAIGPAGTGKTYLAVAIAVAALRDKEVDRIVLARPAVEAGESLGFLPGDYKEKIDPYLRPLYDALYDMVQLDKLRRQIESRTVEVVPLAFMRGRTLNNSFVILDEAQNATPLQMKMFLTRLGVNSKAIITGDITQIDLPNPKESGLVQIQKVLKGIDGIGFVYLDERDVVRHLLVRKIILAYDDFDHKEANNSSH